MIGIVMPYCGGMGCPDKLKCGRYKHDIDYQNEIHFPYAPYNMIEGRCEFMVTFGTTNFLDHIKDLKDEKGRKN